jgi:glycosyltransferase involved in cell wall biosynthesis
MKAENDTLEASDYRPKISVIIPLHNHEKFIGEAIHSVLAQSLPDFELIIINDGSSDGSDEIVRGIHDGRIRYLCQENQGAHAAINRGIRLAGGEYVSILNSDDVYYPARLEECVKILEDDASLDAVFSHMEFIDSGGNFIKFLRGAEENWLWHDPATSFKGEKNVLLDLLAGNFLTTTSNLFCRRKVFDTIGYFSDLRYAHDYDFFLRLCSRFRVHVIEKPLVKYRIHDANTVKENEAAVSFEVGLVLASFFSGGGPENIFRKTFRDDNERYTAMMKFFNSINTCQSERMIMTLLLFDGRNAGEDGGPEPMAMNADNPFRRACIEKLQSRIDSWQGAQDMEGRLAACQEEIKKWVISSQEGWKKVEELNCLLHEKIQESLALRSSWSFRFGRLLTWPMRRLMGKG